MKITTLSLTAQGKYTTELILKSGTDVMFEQVLTNDDLQILAEHILEHLGITKGVSKTDTILSEHVSRMNRMDDRTNNLGYKVDALEKEVNTSPLYDLCKRVRALEEKAKCIEKAFK